MVLRCEAEGWLLANLPHQNKIFFSASRNTIDDDVLNLVNDKHQLVLCAGCSGIQVFYILSHLLTLGY